MGAIGALLISFALVFVTVEVTGQAVFSGALGPGPENETMRLTVPSMERVQNTLVYTGAADDKEKLSASTLHLASTGFPWEEEANVYIAGHRLGYPRTESFLVFYDLHKVEEGDAIILRDSQDRRYVYRVFDKFVTAPGDLGVTRPPEGENIVSLQTCTLPNYSRRLIVQGELVRTRKPPRNARARL